MVLNNFLLESRMMSKPFKN